VVRRRVCTNCSGESQVGTLNRSWTDHEIWHQYADNRAQGRHFNGLFVWNKDVMAVYNMRRIVEHWCNRFALFDWTERQGAQPASNTLVWYSSRRMLIFAFLRVLIHWQRKLNQPLPQKFLCSMQMGSLTIVQAMHYYTRLSSQWGSKYWAS
jgi:hypothetical protein